MCKSLLPFLLLLDQREHILELAELLYLPQELDLIGVFEQVEEELAVFLLLDALGLTGIVVVHSIDNFFEGDKFEGSCWFFV
jgi:hypothetical protein